MHKASIHDPKKKSKHKLLRIKGTIAHQNPTKYPKKTRKSLETREGNQRNHECFHTSRDQILCKIMKKI
jgi:hypothetical protein